jgi:hypothetical protein
MAPAAAPPREMHQFPPGVCSFPVFGVCWTPLEPLPEGGGSHEGQGNWGVHPSPEAGVVVAGGGGNLKSGVNNRIAFYSLKADSTGASVPVLRHETDTHPRVCSAVAVDDKGHLLGACFGKVAYGTAFLHSLVALTCSHILSFLYADGPNICGCSTWACSLGGIPGR